ncbi:MAG: hypothetical protein Homavirus3_1, partial [Homavirus sp.]
MDLFDKIDRLSKSNEEILDRCDRYMFSNLLPWWSIERMIDRYCKNIVLRPTNYIYNNHMACGTTSAALMDLNPFNQSYYVNL